MALGTQVVDLGRLNIVNEICHLSGDREISIMEMKPDLWRMRVMVDMINAVGVKSAGTADKPVDLIAFVQKKLSQVAAILACNARN
jgi:hypothetical protein